MLSVCLDVNQGGTNQPLHTNTSNLVWTELLMNPDQKPKTRSTWPNYRF